MSPSLMPSHPSPAGPRRWSAAVPVLLVGVLLTLLLPAPVAADRGGERGPAMPDWAKPYARTATPKGDFIATGDRWIILRSEILVGRSAQGGIRRTFRQVLKPNTTGAAELMLAVNFNEAAQRLEGPEVWVPRGLRHRTMDIGDASLDVPLLQGSTITAMRSLLVSTEPIRPGRRNVIATWVVEDTETFPGEDAILPLEAYPVMEFHVRAEDDAVALTFVGADGEVRPVPTEGITLREIPAAQNLFVDEENPWVGSLLSSVPFVHVTAHTEGARDWGAVAARTRALFESALAADTDADYREQALALTRDVEAIPDKIASLAAFTQALTYRDIQWGIGAFLPDSPQQVLRSRSADCKGKALLLQAMLASIGVRSSPVLVNIDDHFQDYQAPASPLAFNHVVLAIDAPDAQALPGRLREGPGAGWVLFDPTDPISTYGLPANRVAGRAGLWLGAPGSLFRITQAGDQPREEVHLEIDIAADGSASFRATVAGPGDFSYRTVEVATAGAISERFRQLETANLREVIPGVEIAQVRYLAPDHRGQTPMLVEVSGSIPLAVEPLAGELYSLTAPMHLLSRLTGFPVRGVDYTPARRDVGVPSGWQVDPCCEAQSHHLRARIDLQLPAGWRVQRSPQFAAVDNDWLSARTDSGPAHWQADITWRRGRFPDQRPEDRAADLNRVAEAFRQPFLVERED